MRRLPRTALLAALWATVSSAEVEPAAKLSIAYRWTNGAVAPLFSTEYFIEIRSQGESEISLHMGRQEGEERRVTQEFRPDPSELQRLVEYVRKRRKRVLAAAIHHGAPPSPPGAGLCGLVLAESGTTHAVPCDFGGKPSLAERVRHLVPESVMQSIETEHAEFLAKHTAKQDQASPSP